MTHPFVCRECGAAFKLSDGTEGFADGVRHADPRRCISQLVEQVDELRETLRLRTDAMHRTATELDKLRGRPAADPEVKP